MKAERPNPERTRAVADPRWKRERREYENLSVDDLQYSVIKEKLLIHTLAPPHDFACAFIAAVKAEQLPIPVKRLRKARIKVELVCM